MNAAHPLNTESHILSPFRRSTSEAVVGSLLRRRRRPPHFCTLVVPRPAATAAASIEAMTRNQLTSQSRAVNSSSFSGSETLPRTPWNTVGHCSTPQWSRRQIPWAYCPRFGTKINRHGGPCHHQLYRPNGAEAEASKRLRGLLVRDVRNPTTEKRRQHCRRH